MNGFEALWEAYRNEKKVRPSDWPSNCFISYEKNQWKYNPDDGSLPFCFAVHQLNTNDWEFYKEPQKPVSFAEAYKAYRNGTTIKSVVTKRIVFSFYCKYDLKPKKNAVLINDIDDEEIDGKWIILDDKEEEMRCVKNQN